MDMKEYMAPEMDVIKIKMQVSLLAISGSEEDDDNPGGGEYNPGGGWG